MLNKHREQIKFLSVDGEGCQPSEGWQPFIAIEYYGLKIAERKYIFIYMNRFLRTIIAGYGAKKMGGGCLGTIVVFLLIYFALGYCN